ncbi:putative nitrogen fixation protein [Rhizobium sullae]|nr:putative nitrogen fixation protein [Rhizobium sullae]
MTTRSNPAVIPAASDDKSLEKPFIKCLVRLIRAEDTYGRWRGKCDVELLDNFTVPEDQRRAIPIIGDPDPYVLWRLKTFYTAVGLGKERSDLLVSRTMEISQEGFGRVLLTTKRLVLLSKTLRDVHRFGFNNLRKCAKTGTQLVSDAVQVIEAYPDLARS